MSKPLTRILIADDHQALRQGVRTFLETQDRWQIVAEASDGHDALKAARDTQPDIAILDYSLPLMNGLELTRALKQEFPRIEILIYTMHDREDLLVEVLRAGARGYLNKAGEPAELVAAIRTVMQGRKYVTAEVAQMLVDNLHAPESEELHASLSERELQTLQKIASGKKLSDIAEELMLSPKTVSVYRARVLEKLHLANNAELTVYAIRNGIV